MIPRRFILFSKNNLMKTFMSPNSMHFSERFEWCLTPTAELDNYPKKKGSNRLFAFFGEVYNLIAEELELDINRIMQQKKHSIGYCMS
jgi:hypothetical protein